MKLSKDIPARRETIKFNWCKTDFMEMSERYRNCRKGMEPTNACFWCGYKFNDGDMMALARPKKGANKILCQSCAAELQPQ